MKWRHWEWTDDPPHPWVKLIRDVDEEDDNRRCAFETRLFSPVSDPWPLVSISTSVLVPTRGAKGRVLAGLNGVTLSDCPKAAPMVRLHVSIKPGLDDHWLEHYVGIPVALISEATAMLETAAKFKLPKEATS